MITTSATHELGLNGRSLGRFNVGELRELSAAIGRILYGKDDHTARILSAVGARYHVSADQLTKSSTKESWIAQPRLVAIYLVSKHAKLPDHTVGEMFGRTRDTVRYARIAIKARLDTDRSFRADFAAIESHIELLAKDEH